METTTTILIVLFLSVGCTHGQQDEQELVFSMKTTSGYKVGSVKGDPNVYLPKLKADGTLSLTTWSLQSGTFMNALATHRKSGTLLWSNPDEGDIESIPNNFGTGIHVSPVHTETTDKVRSIAVDWSADNIYWTDSTFNRVHMAALNTRLFDGENIRGQRIVIQEDLKEPWGIAIHPAKSFLFFTDSTLGRVERASLSGQERMVLASSTRPTSLTLDVNTDTLYWLDVVRKRVSTCSIDGQAKSDIFEMTHANAFNGLVVYQDWLFTTNQDENRVEAIRITNPSESAWFSRTDAVDIYDITMYTPYTQPNVPSPCASAGCDQLCVGRDVNTAAQCLCSHGFHMEDSKCTLTDHFRTPRYIYVGSNQVCWFEADAPFDSIAPSGKCVFINIDLVAIAQDMERLFLYVLASDATLIRVTMGVTEFRSVTVTVLRGVNDLKGMAVDWVSGNLFWSEGDPGRIAVTTLKGSIRVLYTGLQQPRGILADPVNGMLYWISADVPAIQYGPMTGGTPMDLVTTGLEKPQHLALDHVDRVLYWTDGEKGSVEAIRLSDNHRWTVFSDTDSFPFGLSVYQDHIAWTDRETSKVNWARREEGGAMEKQHQMSLTLGDMVTWDSYEQPSSHTNACSNGGGCEDICLPDAINPRTEAHCFCNIGLTSNGPACETALVSDNFILVTDANLHEILQVDLGTQAIHAIRTSLAISYPVAVTYDPVGEQVCWSDVDLETISCAKLDGSEERVLAHTGNDSVVNGMAADYFQRYIYYVDAYTDTISKVHLDQGGTPIVLVHMTSTLGVERDPRGIVLDLEANEMYWSDWGTTPKIHRADMNGNFQEVVVNRDLRWPAALALDDKDLCWVDSWYNTVECIGLDGTGTNRRKLVDQNSGLYYGIQMTDTHVYFSDRKSSTLFRVSRSAILSVPESFGDAVLEYSTDIHLHSSELVNRVSRPTKIPSTTTTMSTMPTTTKTTTTTTRTFTSRNITRTTTVVTTGVSSNMAVTTGVSSNMAVAIGVGVGGVVLLFIIIVVSICCCCKTCKSSPNPGSFDAPGGTPAPVPGQPPYGTQAPYHGPPPYGTPAPYPGQPPYDTLGDRGKPPGTGLSDGSTPAYGAPAYGSPGAPIPAYGVSQGGYGAAQGHINPGYGAQDFGARSDDAPGNAGAQGLDIPGYPALGEIGRKGVPVPTPPTDGRQPSGYDDTYQLIKE